MSLFLSFFPVRVRVLVPGEGCTRPLTPVGVCVPVRGEGRMVSLPFVFEFPVRAAWSLTPVCVLVPGEGRMVAHVCSCSSSR